MEKMVTTQLHQASKTPPPTQAQNQDPNHQDLNQNPNHPDLKQLAQNHQDLNQPAENKLNKMKVDSNNKPPEVNKKLQVDKN